MSQKEQIVKCVKGCWDGVNCIEYIKGDEAKIHPESSLAQYFEGWKPGTKVQIKERYRDDDNKVQVRVVLKEIPGKVEKPEEDAEPEKKICEWCDKEFKNLAVHQLHCKEKPADAEGE